LTLNHTRKDYIVKKTTLAFLLMSSLPLTSNALNLTPPQSGNNSDWYYGLGGEQVTSAPPSFITNSLVLGGEVTGGSGFNCSSFNPTLGIANTLNDVKSGVNSIQQQLVSAATGAIASLPMLMLQRANPGLYDMLMNATASAKEAVNLSTKSCEVAMEEIGDGKNPYSDWVKVSRSRDWKTAIGDDGYHSSSSDATEVKRTVEQNAGKNGVDWLEGKPAGGKNMRPINIPSDIAKAGYNISLNRGADTNSIADGKDSRIAELWPEPQSLVKYSESVLGKMEIRTYNQHPVNTMPGRGLSFEIYKESTDVKDKLNALINSTQLSGKALMEVSAPNMYVDASIIESLKEINPRDRSILTARLANEIGTAREVEKALLLRRMLETGLHEPNVAASGAGKESTREYVDMLTESINTVMFEADISKKLAVNTANTISDIQRNKEIANKSRGISPSKQAVELDNGGSN